MKCPKGFTLIEVLIVVVIIGILAAAVLPRFTGQTERARAAEAVNIMSAIRRGVLSYYDAHLHWPVDIASIADMESTLGLTFQPSAYGWAFKTVKSSDEKACAVEATISEGNALTLDVASGAWSGTGDYVAGTGKFWPYLPQVVADPVVVDSGEGDTGDGNIGGFGITDGNVE